ncbi:MAG TPA: DUF302 domain-containing protein [Bacteroidota bacterium]|nr:DUF302 domain-containing protein [Bacteroidota bacterium]
MRYGFSRAVDLPYEAAVRRVTEQLKAHGFGVLTTIDVKETLKQKLNAEFTKYVILGACNPSLAYQALQVEMDIGLLLPCNLIVYEKAGKTVLGAFDPLIMVPLVDKPELAKIAADVKQRLQSVLESI